MRLSAPGMGVCFALVLVGCPKKQSEPLIQDGPMPVRPTLVRTWSEVDPAHYPEFVLAAEEERAATTEDLGHRRDTDQWSRRDTTWGEPALDVIEFTDADRPSTDLPAVAAWILAAPGVTEQDGDAPREVRAVLLRDFTGAPFASTPEELVPRLGDRFPPPWAFCRPATRPEHVVVYDVARGWKVGLAAAPDWEPPVEEPSEAADSLKLRGGWTVDHVEFLRPDFVPEEWWTAKGYGECVGFAAMDAQGRVRKLRPRP